MVFTRELGTAKVLEESGRTVPAPCNFTLTLPDEYGNVLTVTSKETFHDKWSGDDWLLTLNITLAPEEEGEEPETFLDLTLDMRGMPFHDLYQTAGNITFTGDGTGLQEPFAASIDLDFFRTDIEKPNKTTLAFSPVHPESGQRMLTIHLELLNSEVPFTVLQERDYPQEDIFHLNDEYLQRIKESYIPTLAINFLPVIAEMPAGVINDIIRFAEETDILVSLGVE